MSVYCASMTIYFDHGYIQTNEKKYVGVFQKKRTLKNFPNC